jgi:spore maturation protein SpmB
LLVGLIFAIFGYSLLREKEFAAKGTTIFNSFVEGAYNGLAVGRIIFPYILGMLVAISLFRNSGLFDIFANSLTTIFRAIHVNDQIVNALPIAILRPFSSAGSRGFLLDAMGTYGADSFTGRLSCVFQCAAETTFYVLAVYFGSVKIKNTRYALSTMLLVDLICVCAAVGVCLTFFQLPAASPAAH